MPGNPSSFSTGGLATCSIVRRGGMGTTVTIALSLRTEPAELVTLTQKVVDVSRAEVVYVAFVAPTIRPSGRLLATQGRTSKCLRDGGSLFTSGTWCVPAASLSLAALHRSDLSDRHS